MTKHIGMQSIVKKNISIICVVCGAISKRYCIGCGDCYCSKCDSDLNLNGKLCKDCRQLLSYGIIPKGR